MARGRRPWPGVLLVSDATLPEGVIVQTLPAFTQALEGAPVDVSGDAAQTLAVFTQAAVGVSGTGRRAYLTYVVLETNDPPITGVITQTGVAFIQALEGAYDATAVGGPLAQTLPTFTQALTGVLDPLPATLTQTLPVFTQTAAGTVATVRTGIAAQTLAAFTQAAAGTAEGSGVERPSQTWRGVLIDRTWRGRRGRF